MTAKRLRALTRGRLAEMAAALWLRLKGYSILARHVTTGRGTGAGEIDIIARRGNLLAFIEVKARPDFAQAAQAIGPQQRRRIARAAEAFLARRPELAHCAMRFDAVLVSPWRPLRHISDAWRMDA